MFHSADGAKNTFVIGMDVCPNDTSRAAFESYLINDDNGEKD